MGRYTVRGADVADISRERYARQSGPGYLDVAPNLIVDVSSPNDARSDLMAKLREYFVIGVRMFWVANPRSRTVQAFRSPTDVREVRVGDELPGDDLLPGFRVDVRAWQTPPAV